MNVPLSHDAAVFLAGTIVGLLLALLAMQVGIHLAIRRRRRINPEPPAQRYTAGGRPIPGPGRDSHPGNWL